MAGMLGADAESFTISELQSRGIQFLSQYVSDFTSKNMTLAGNQALTAVGIWTVTNWEDNINDASGGYPGGQRNASVAWEQHKAAGGPDGRPVYFSIDEDVSPLSTVSYFQGINAQIGRAQSGVYGSAAVCDYLHANGYVSWTWRSMSTGWSGGAGNPSDFNVIQTGMFNSSLDEDVAETGDIGQWMIGKVPGGNSMLSQSDINAVALAVWAYINTAAGDTVDMHQLLVNIAKSQPADVGNAVWSWKNKQLDNGFDMRQYLVNAANQVKPPANETGSPIA
jgi:hypothetical protein